MDRTEYGDVSHALCATMGFFGKRMDPQTEKIWFAALRGHDAQDIRKALAQYTRVGRYAPKPVDILELLAKHTSPAQQFRDVPYTPCPEHIKKAWKWLNSRITDGSALLEGLFAGCDDVDGATKEKYLVTVNEEAKKHNLPEAIPRECWLEDIWGKPCPHKITL